MSDTHKEIEDLVARVLEENRSTPLSQEDSDAIMELMDDGMRKFFALVRGSRAVYPVKIDVVGGNGSRMSGVLHDAEADPVFGDASKDMMMFPVSLTATDRIGRRFLNIKIEQPHPVTADEGKAPS
jgi:hypothetical protein